MSQCGPSVEAVSFIAGEVWLDSGLTRPPDANDLADVCDRLHPCTDTLATVRACVPVADAVGWVLKCRALPPPQPDVPRW